MLGDISPQSVKIDSSAVVYPGRNHVTALSVKKFDGSKYVAADVSLLTRVVLVFPQLDPVVAFDSNVTAGVFTWSGSTITVDLSDYAMPSSIQQSYLIVYDAEHTSGQVLVDDNSSVLEWDFRNISATGLLPPPVVELVGEAPIDDLLYGRKNGAWVSIEEVVAGVVSVNGESGVVVLDAADVGADPAGTAAAAVAAHVALPDPHSQYVQNATNLGAGSGLFKQKAAGVLEFKTLVAGSNIVLTPVGDTVVVDSVGGGSVDSVNGQTGVVVLDAADVGADPAGTAAAAVAAHVALPDPHSQYATDTDLVDARFQSTGLISGGALSINGGDNTKFDVASGFAVFADYTNPQQSDATVLPFGPLTAVTVPNLATANVSYVGINVSGTIVQQTSQFTNTQRRTICSLGAVVHSNHINLNAVNTIVAAHRQLLNQFGDGIRAIGQLNLSGNVYSAVGANLQIQKTSGELFSPGANFHSNPDDPHSISLSAGSPLTFRYRLANGTEFADTTLINPAQYDNAGVLTAVPNNKFTVQLIAVFQSGLTRIQYGQVVYDTLADAVAGAQSQSMTLEQNIAENGIVRGYLAVKFDATALNNAAQAQFITLSKFSAAAAVSPLSIATTDQLSEGTNNLYHTAARVRTTILTGLSTATNAIITAADTVLDAFGKLQAQITAHFGVGGSTHPAATTSVAGFLSAADKTKLDGVATNANNYVHPNHSGDVTSVGDGAQTIAANAVTNAKAADMAVNTIKGRITTGTGDPEDLTATQVRTIINVADGANNYVHPNHSGDVTSVGDGAQTIAANAVSNTKLADMATQTIKGRNTAGTGDPEDLTAAQVRTIINVADGAIALSSVATFTGNKTLALSDINTYNVSQDGTAQTVTIPAQATVAWTANAEIHIEQGGAGTVTITGATGVTVNGVSAGSVAMAAQRAVVTLKRTASNTWTVIGGIANSLVSGPASAGDGNLVLFNGTTGKTIKDGGTVTAAGLALLDDANAAAQRTTLGVGTGDSPTFTALTLSNGQIAFPATQVPSANANTLDDYEEGTWTPVLTFVTPGNLNVVYSVQNATYTKIGRFVLISFLVRTSTFTHTTASGIAQITGSPFISVSNFFGGLRWKGITKASYTDVESEMQGGVSTITFVASGSGQETSNISTADMPTGGSVELFGTLTIASS